LVGLSGLLEHARRGGYAVGAFNFCNAETAQAIAEEAGALRSPVIIMTGPWEIPLLGPKMMADVVRSAASEVDVPVCLHLDHAADFELAQACLEAGFPSVMIDGSRREFEENVRLTRQVVEAAHALGADVEGELGAVGYVDDATVEGAGEASLTDPGQAAEFVERTGVDALAVAIGNAHGMYRQRPELDFGRLEAIAKATPVALVLHGGTGTPPEQLHRAIEIGVSKVNVATELCRAFLDGMQRELAATGGKAWYAQVLMTAKAATRQVAGRWMRELGSAGRVGPEGRGAGKSNDAAGAAHRKRGTVS
jgi:ketose-bisphosphate aldolase